MLGATPACFLFGDDFDDGDSGDDGPPGGNETIPDNAYCDPVADWSAGWSALEVEVLELVNQNRDRGANCGSAGSFGPAPTLGSSGALRCASRVHSMDLATRDYFEHTNPEGEQAWDRMERAGYDYIAAGENIAAGSPTAAAVMDGWMASDGHCANIMSRDFEHIGIGYFEGAGEWGVYWTQDFGTPR